MRFTRTQRRRAAFGGAFSVPVLTVLATVSILNRAGPTAVQASGSVTSIGAGPGLDRTRSMSPAVVAACDRITELDSLHFGAAPFFDPRAFDTPDDPIEIVTDDTLGVGVGLVMKSRGGNLALLDGKTHREGDMVEGTPWRVLTIDVPGRAVTFQHVDDDREVTLTVDGR